MLALLTFVTLALTNYASAQTSLYIPGFDPQPVTANEIGVGADGQTTWLIAPGVSSGTLVDNGFFGPATLIAGPSAAEVIWDSPDLGLNMDEKCVINGDSADCTALIASGTSTSTAFVTETVNAFAIQGGGASSISGGADSGAATPVAGSSPASGAAQTAPAASQTSPTTSAPAQTSAPSGSSQVSSGAPQSSSSGSPSPSPAPSDNGVTKVGWSVAAVWLSGVSIAMMLFA